MFQTRKKYRTDKGKLKEKGKKGNEHSTINWTLSQKSLDPSYENPNFS